MPLPRPTRGLLRTRVWCDASWQDEEWQARTSAATGVCSYEYTAAGRQGASVSRRLQRPTTWDCDVPLNGDEGGNVLEDHVNIWMLFL